ncbi:unnamed protein product [Larinioides sclopetarius]|uniref:Uncharacterized protein n=1 Tax=Larinioides sclopetarius TaxID=280406 RepID=A0AAV2A6Z7_9ARAC
MKEDYDTWRFVYPRSVIYRITGDIRVKCAISIQGHDDFVWNMSVERIAPIIFDINGTGNAFGPDNICVE